MENQNSYGPLESVAMIEEKTPKKHMMRIVFITSIVIALAVGGYLLMSQDRFTSQLKNMVSQTPSPNIEQASTQATEYEMLASEIQDRTIPWIELKSDEAEKATVGQEVTILVQAFSGERDVTGYDVLFGVDPAQFEVVSIVSELPDFKIQSFNRQTYHSVTGIKDLQAKGKTLFNGNAILKLVVKPLKAGQGVVSIMSTKGMEKTQFVDSEVEVMEPQVGSVIIQAN